MLAIMLECNGVTTHHSSAAQCGTSEAGANLATLVWLFVSGDVFWQSCRRW